MKKTTLLVVTMLTIFSKLAMSSDLEALPTIINLNNDPEPKSELGGKLVVADEFIVADLSPNANQTIKTFFSGWFNDSDKPRRDFYGFDREKPQYEREREYQRPQQYRQYQREPQQRSEHSYAPKGPDFHYDTSTKVSPKNYPNLVKNPRQIALLLPMSGKHAQAAKAISDGFLAGFYESTENQSYKPRIEIYDTERYGDATRAYNAAVSQGADLVVGPLLKDDVIDISRMSSYYMRVPILALNSDPAVNNYGANLYQYALSPEQEAEQIAEYAWQNGQRNIAVVVPNSSWGQRIRGAFEYRFEKLGGKVLVLKQLGNNSEKAKEIRDLLSIDDSQNRAQMVKNSIREPVDFAPRRRQDLDAIFMAAPPEQARQLSPLLDFYFAHDLPVYATSSVYAGFDDPKDKDLEGVIFCDMPMLIDKRANAKFADLFADQNQETMENHARLFAMGVDAYMLSRHLHFLKSVPGASLNGATGVLSLESGNQIVRSLKFAKMRGGIPQKL